MAPGAGLLNRREQKHHSKPSAPRGSCIARGDEANADVFDYIERSYKSETDTWHQVQTDASVTIRLLMLALAQRVSHI